MRVGLVAPVASDALGASAEDMSAEEDISLSLSLSCVCEKLTLASRRCVRGVAGSTDQIE